MCEAHLACGDTVTVASLPAIGAYRHCIHCDARRRVTGIAAWPAMWHLIVDGVAWVDSDGADSFTSRQLDALAALLGAAGYTDITAVRA